MANNSALGPVTIGLFTLLNVTSLKGAYPTYAGCVGGVVDRPPASPTFPFLWYELSGHDLSGFGEGLDVTELELRLHVFSQASTLAEAQRIMREAIRLVKFSAPTVVGYEIPTIGRPLDEINLPFEELNGIACAEHVTIWTLFACEVAA